MVSDAGAALRALLTEARRRRDAGTLPDRSAWAESCRERKATLLRRTDFPHVPIKPQRVYQEMNRVFGRRPAT